MAPEDVKKTALITKTGLYDWTVMPFGLKNATSTFTRTMSKVFKDLGSEFLKVFVDDLNIHSGSWDKHLQHLDMVLCKLRGVNLKLNPNKCCFAAKNITFLGHVVSKDGTRGGLTFSPAQDGHERQIVFGIDRLLQKVCQRLCSTGSSSIRVDQERC